MNFDTLVDRLTSLYDVGTPRATDVANERLSSMLGSAKSLRGLVDLGTTVAAQATYALPATVVEVFRLEIAYTTGTVLYTGTETLDALQDLARLTVSDPGCGHWYAVAPDADASMNTANLYLSAAPTVAGAAMTGNCAILPATLTYGGTLALPIPLDCHRHLLAGCKAELCDEESTDSSKFEAVFEAGVKRLEARQNSRGAGSDGHRMRMSGYDFGRR